MLLLLKLLFILLLKIIRLIEIIEELFSNCLNERKQKAVVYNEN